MNILLYIFVTLAAYAGMEFMAWFTHKYVMHGILWVWHEDHHQPHHEKHGFFEKNDLFFLVSCSSFATVDPDEIFRMIMPVVQHGYFVVQHCSY